jgi:phospholipase C
MQRSKNFFFEKKKQKTFGHLAEPLRKSRSQYAKVFWFFFSKKNILALLIATTIQDSVAAKSIVFKHIIVVIQENRTPDNLFGSNPTFEPGVNIAHSGRKSDGRIVALKAERLDGCYDISHTHAAFEDAYTRGFDTEPVITPSGCTAPSSPQYKYVDNSTGTVQPYFDIATANGFANRMFQTNQGPSFPAHQFLFGGTAAPLPSTSLFAAENPTNNDAGCTAGSEALVALINPQGSETAHDAIYPCFDHQTLADLLDGANTPIGWRYYSMGETSIWTAPNAIRHICVPAVVGGARACTGADWVQNVVTTTPVQFFTDVAACDLQPVSWIIPTGESSDHASINNGSGPSWVASIVNAIGNAAPCHGESYWDDTAIFVTWDDWGGWFDHVAPFKVVQPYQWGAGYTYGFRVPLLVVSAYTMPGQVSNAVFDFGSILAFIEKNFGLGFIGPGTSNLTRYADYQATLSGRGDLSTFFTRSKPKTFSTIASPLSIRDFLNAPRSVVGPDND